MYNIRDKLENYFEKTVNTPTRWFNWKMGIMGGVPSGIVNYFFNDAQGVIEGVKGGFIIESKEDVK